MTIPSHLKDAKTGDEIWLFDINKAVYKDRKYVTRGDWVIATVIDTTRQSVLTSYSRSKFNIENGQERGNYHTLTAYGQVEKETEEWRNKHAYKLGHAVHYAKLPVAVLKQIADLVGYNYDN